MQRHTCPHTQAACKNRELGTIIYTQRTCKAKNRFSDTILLDKEPPKLPLNLLCAGYLLLGIEPVHKSCLFPQ